MKEWTVWPNTSIGTGESCTPTQLHALVWKTSGCSESSFDFINWAIFSSSSKCVRKCLCLSRRNFSLLLELSKQTMLSLHSSNMCLYLLRHLCAYLACQSTCKWRYPPLLSENKIDWHIRRFVLTYHTQQIQLVSEDVGCYVSRTLFIIVDTTNAAINADELSDACSYPLGAPTAEIIRGPFNL